MKRIALYFGMVATLVASCSIQEVDFKSPQKDDVVFYASFEQPAEDGTRVYANEDLLLRWTSDDRVSIFNKVTYNQEYKFTGETGDNGGSFSKVGDEFATGNAISHIVSVYPYQKSTKISENENLTIELPAKQLYAENTFGLGANTMVSVTSDNLLQYKNVGGYLVLNLYGEGVSVSSITLKGNNGEKLAGKATVSMPLDGVPATTMTNDATSEITLTCATPVQLGATAEESTQFWFVVPPVTFSKGFQITIVGDDGIFKKTTEKTITIKRNNLSKMSPIEVDISHLKNVIHYTSSDGSVVSPYNSDAFGTSILSNEYVDGQGTIIFDGDVESIGDQAFYGCKSLTSITIPDNVASIGDYAFFHCESLASITIPDGVTSIGYEAFSSCYSLTGITIPDSVTSIGGCAFVECESLTSITIPDSVTSIRDFTFEACTSLTNITIPGSVTSIGDSAFAGCTSLTNITIPDSVTSMGGWVFQDCIRLTNITIKSKTPPTGYVEMFVRTNNAPIYVPAESVEAYKSAQYWSDYADRIQAIPSIPFPEAIDLGLPSGLKWASFNLGASKPEEFGDYYAWGETETKDDYSWATYKWGMGDWYTMTKYCSDSSYGYNGFTDGKTVLDPEDDAAHVNLGGKWRMPTDVEWTELREHCSWAKTTQNNIKGCLVTGTNGNRIFLPAAGGWFETSTSINYLGTQGYYWSSSLDDWLARLVSFDPYDVYRSCCERSPGLSVRPVYAE